MFCIHMEFLFISLIFNNLTGRYLLVPHFRASRALKLIEFISMCLSFKGKDERGRGACVDPAPG